MVRRLILWSVLAGVFLAGGLMAHRKGLLVGAKSMLVQKFGDGSSHYSDVRFRVDLVDRLNYARIASKQPTLRLDPELDDWLQKVFPTLVLDDMDEITRKVQEALPRYYHVAVCTADAPTLRNLLDRFQEFAGRNSPEMTNMGCAVRASMGGLSNQALVVIGQRLVDFSPEALTERDDEAFFSRCLHCQHPHIVRVSRQQHSLGLECPNCRRTYAVVAAAQDHKFRYVNEFLTGYAPPAVFSKDIARIHELFTICSAVHGNCIYTRDPGLKKNATDAWQTSLETQRLGQGDCEDSSIYLCDWLIARGYNARVALGRYGDLGGHAWVVVKMHDVEYLLESTESAPDPRDPPLVSKVGSRYVPEILFDRFGIYVRSTPGQALRSQDGYFSPKTWTRVEPRMLTPSSKPLVGSVQSAVSKPLDPSKLARTNSPNPAAAPFMELEEIPRGAAVWQMPLPMNQTGSR